MKYFNLSMLNALKEQDITNLSKKAFYLGSYGLKLCSNLQLTIWMADPGSLIMS